MVDLARSPVRGPDTATPEAYRRRVVQLAVIYAALFWCSLAGSILTLWQGKLFVTLAQRSNVETLTILFLLVLFCYLAVLSAPGMTGAAKMAWFRLSAADRTERERRKTAALGKGSSGPIVALNVVLEREGHPGEAFELPIADEAGSMGTLLVDGAKLMHREARRDGSQNLMAFVARQVETVLEERGIVREVGIVEWKALDDEATEQYLGLVHFARRLARKLDDPDLWPRVVLQDADIAALAKRLSAICPALRNEAFLPEWEYSAEHKLPIIPEPLGIVSLGRSERRADPLATMGCALIVTIAALVAIVSFIVFHPWVPGV